MVLRILGGVLLLIVALVSIAASWFFRPWSDYSPARVQAAFQPENIIDVSLNMASYFPYADLEATDPDPLPRETRPLDVSYEFDGETRSLGQYLELTSALGLVVVHDGVIVHEQYLNGADEMSRPTSWSVAKSFVATLIAMALQEGRIDSLDQLAREFAPQFEGSAFGETSLRHLLMMSTGIDFVEDYDDPDSDVGVLFADPFVWGSDIDQSLLQFERVTDPGTELDYISSASHVLSAVLRGIYDQPLHQIVQEKIWTPLGMESDAYWNQNIMGEDGVALGYCCLNARPVDYARLGLLYLSDGVWDGERLLPEGWVEMATRANAPFQEADATYPLRGYGLHFWFPETDRGEFFAAGIYGQYIWVDPSRNLVISRFAADPQWGPNTAETFAAFRAIAAEVAGE
ncbi:serine hydrolase domain-containing protein [Hyphobacterium indicum]|uniref:serine hydrolase domain-containing protein n=1 Tax=Hyphobacterium indicum TaxID=2162714 RepID=UPI000D65D49D|nr:serine hydrolase [Hyphobacterium indicum]